MQNTQTSPSTATINPVADSRDNIIKKSTPKIVRSHEAIVFETPGEKGSLFLGGEATGDRLITGTIEATANSGPLPHIHTHEDEIFIIQSGEFELFLNVEYILANEGDVIFGARGEVHGFRGMPHSEPNIFTGIVAPAGFEHFFAGRAALMASPDTTTEQLNAHAASFGIDFFDSDVIIPLVESPKSRVVRAGTAPVLEAFGDRAEVLLASAQTGGKYTLFSLQTPAQNGPPLHIHELEDELFFIQEGTYEFVLETEAADGSSTMETVIANSGDVVWAPRNWKHSFRNVGESTGHMYIAMLPGNFDEFFAANAKAFENGTATPENLVAIGAEYGIRYII